MTTQFTDIKHEVFTSKEHYLAFRQAWKDYINSGKAKPEYWDNGSGGMIKDDSDLTAAHHLLYCILIGRDLSRSFKPAKVNTDKHGFHEAMNSLAWWISQADDIANFDFWGDDVKVPSYIPAKKYPELMERKRASLMAILEPFGGTLTPQMLSKAFTLGVALRDFSNTEAEQEEAA